MKNESEGELFARLHQEREARHERSMRTDPAYRQRYERERAAASAREAERLERVRQARGDTLLKLGVRPPVVGMLMSGEQRETAALVATRAFEAQEVRTMLVLAGPPGVGKTCALAWLALQRLQRHDEAVERWHSEYPRPRLPGAPHMVTAAALARIDRYDADALRLLFEAPLLIVDDLGVEHADRAGWFLSFVDELIGARYSSNRITAASTNLSGKTFAERYGARVQDRLVEVGTYVELRGPSLRAPRVVQ